MFLYSLHITIVNDEAVTDQGKSKAIPLKAWTGLEGSRRSRFPDFKTIGI